MRTIAIEGRYQARIAKIGVTHPDGTKFISAQVFTSEAEVDSFLSFALDAQAYGYTLVTLGVWNKAGETLEHLND
jgi:hypothetical protein